MALSLNPAEHPIIFTKPRRLTIYSAWHEHVPFAMLLVELLNPQVFVELGTHYGDSYCAFCQAVADLEIGTRCYAIDTWEGDPHTGFYGEEVLQDLRKHHDPLYGSFSRLLQSSFDEALVHFEDGMIDLLHIDGYHSYECVRHDFESWLPKMSDKGVVLLHDTNVREGDFGVWKLWSEVMQRYPGFEFLHGHGLGVLAVGASPPPAVEGLLQLSGEDLLTFRDFFFRVGHALGESVRFESERRELGQQLEERDRALAELRAHLVEQDGRLAALQAELHALTGSRAWRTAETLWRIRSRVAPPGSFRARVLGLERRAN